jgi:subtilase family serine protease
LGALAALAALAGSAAGSSSGRLVRLPALPGPQASARVIGALPSAQRLHLTVVLEPPHPGALAAFATAVSDPGSPSYRDYLTPAQFARRFGATVAELRTVIAYLRARGLRPGPVAADRLSIRLTASAGQVERAFRLTLERVALARGRLATVASAPPALAPQVARDVQTILGLTSVSAPRPLLQRPRLGRAAVPRTVRHVQTGGPQPCSQASAAASQQGAYTADQIASAYGLPGLYRAGDQGQGITVAEYELEGYDPADIAAYQACYGTHAAVRDVPVDGGPTSLAPGSGEAALDIENAIGLAPRATFLVYEGPNANQSVPGSGPYDTFSAIVNQDRAQVISVSWGECEQLEGSSGAQAESALFEQAAAQGQTVISASGDEGSEDCNQANGLPDPRLAVDDPAGQPFVTGVGGTTTSRIGPPPAQTVWNGGGSAAALLGLAAGAGGGGVSALWGMPGYQGGAPAALHVVNGQSTGSSCGARAGYCREVPDVAADADPATGYLIYYNGSGANPTAPAGWQAVGGTSAAAPVWAAIIALVDASSACHASPVGFANPALYRAAASAYASYFDDVTSGDNDFTGTNGGLYPAGPGYDMASGLGTPKAAALAGSLCSGALRLVNPGTQTAAVGEAVSLQLRTTGPVSGRPVYLAGGLPPGLALGRYTGRIAGKPTRVGTFHVVAVVLDSSLAIREAAFSWLIQARPTVTFASLAGVGAGRPRLRLTIDAGRGAPGLSGILLTLPGGLRFTSSRVLVTGLGGRRIRFHATLAHGRLTITLLGAPRSVTVTVAYPALSTGGALASHLRRHPETLRLALTVTDAGHHAVPLTVRVRAR